ncbi:hypothetical protein [Streptomyces sp. NPDC052179]|uniref:hypothetical protein n=1 Tax=Streptomyces sp. NPDC052179 TaxID=3155680 RepID=UPI003438DA1E
MSTETIGATPQPAPAPAWQSGLRLAMNATWKAIGVTVTIWTTNPADAPAPAVSE